MGGGVGLGLTFLQVGLVASWGLRAEHSSANWSAWSEPPTPKPINWTTQLAMATSNGTSTGADPVPAIICRGEEDCPPWSRCEPQAGRSSCRCDLGYHLSPTLGCVPVRAFPAQLLLLHLDALGPPEEEEEEEEEAAERLPWLASQMQGLFQRILGHVDGYLGSSTRGLKWPSTEVTVLHHFSAWVPVTAHGVKEAVAAFRGWCRDSSHVSTPACVLLSHVGTYRSLSLCHFDLCDSSSTLCSFQDGLVRCQCRPGYLQAHAADRTCTACGSGFWLRNGTCTRCPFGFSGAGCQEPFLLALVVVSCVAGLLLLLLTSLALSGRALHPQEPSTTPQLPLHSTLSLPRVRPPWTMQETEGGALGSRAPFSLWDTDGLPPVAGAPTMKTFLGPPSSPASAPWPLGGCSNLVFVSDAEERGE